MTSVSRGWLYVRMGPSTHNILMTIALARGLHLIDFFDQITKEYQPIVSMLQAKDKANSHSKTPSPEETA
jgi:hypothetical protein